MCLASSAQMTSDLPSLDSPPCQLLSHPFLVRWKESLGGPLGSHI
jgi:hypothetical protein